LELPAPAALADLFPVLDNLGVRVAGDAGFQIRPVDRPAVLLEEFTVVDAASEPIGDPSCREALTTAFDAVWCGAADDDAFNQARTTPPQGTSPPEARAASDLAGTMVRGSSGDDAYQLSVIGR
jgi:hypothetical protein